MNDAAKARSDLPTRFVVAVALIAVAIAAIYSGGWWFRILVAAAAAMMMLEWAEMHGVKRLQGQICAGIMGISLLAIAEYLYPVTDTIVVRADALAVNLQGFMALAALSLLVGALCGRLKMGWGFLYIAIPSFCLLSLGALLTTRMMPVFWVLGVTWAVDIFAYFAGRAIGGPKLAPRISPNKTWAGLIGGMIGAGLIGWLIAYCFEMQAFFLWAGAPMGAIAQLGDLYESWEKRRAGIKDSGNLLPGHGGVLDRLDGLLAVALVTTLLLMAGVWTA